MKPELTVDYAKEIQGQGGVHDVRAEGRESPLLERIDEWRTCHPYAATALETTAVWAGREALTGVVHAGTSVKVGHGWKNSRLGRLFSQPAVALGVGLVLSPHLEERICREQPSRYLDRAGREGLQAPIGTLAAAVFATGHAGREAVPVPQFVGGLNYWRLQRTRGFKHAVLAHALHNGLAWGASRLKQKISATSRG